MQAIITRSLYCVPELCGVGALSIIDNALILTARPKKAKLFRQSNRHIEGVEPTTRDTLAAAIDINWFEIFLMSEGAVGI